ncbi:vitellogenin receptor-like [Planococcus citri]|uniref:vitellogenin receptor-like n=1 Tax=Planococcus citri TaxID=170843 RepID=UPI0031F8CBB8
MAIVKLGCIILFSLLTRVYGANLEYRTFRCRNGTYISDRLVGDGKVDCVADGTDERFVYCDRFSDRVKECRREEGEYSEFKYIKHFCKSSTGRCNTIKECTDGTDESDCGDEINTEDCSSKNGKYLCADGLRCLDLNYTCDGFCNCFDCSDEKYECKLDEHLINITQESSHKVCFQTSNESVCCSEYNSTCKECDFNNKCDHKCVQFANQTGCFCDEHYIGVPGTQNSKCQPSNVALKEKLLLFSTSHEIKAIKLSTNDNSTVKMIENRDNYYFTALTAFQDYVYYATREAQPALREVAYPFNVSDHENKTATLIGYTNHPANTTTIFKTSINSEETHELIKFHFDDVEVTSLAVDWVTNNIYLTTELFLSVYSQDGSIYKDLKHGNTTCINLAPAFGLMFWAQIERIERIERNLTSEYMNHSLVKSSMDGSDETILITSDSSVEVVTVDESSGRVYWYCSSSRKVQSVNFDGGDRRSRSLDSPIYGPSVYFEREIFFIQLGNKIVSVHKDTKAVTLRFPVLKEVLYNNRFDNTSDNLRLLYMYNPKLQRVNIQNPCPESCTGLCLTRPSLSENVLNYTCWYDESKEVLSLLANSDDGWFSTSWILIISAIVFIIALIVGILVYFRIRKRNSSQSDRLTDDTG